MKFLISLLSTMLFVAHAYADCVVVPDKQAQVNIDKISAPVFDASGNELKGCLLHSDGKILGYSKNNGICHMVPTKNVSVRLSYGCCDTGPDDGDIECIVRSKSLLGIGAAHGNGVIVNPSSSAKPQ
jgi:hypothetical protein